MASNILTSRLILRAWTDDDAEAWADMNADPRVMEFFPSTDSRERSLQSAHVLRSNLDRDGCGWWIVEVRDGMPFAGVIALQPVPFEAPFTPANEIGWRFRADVWGMGYATEGALTALKFAFEQLNWREVVAMTASINLRSRRVMERLGMTHDLATISIIRA